MKRLLALLMAIMVLTLAFTACSKKGEDTNEPTQTETHQNSQAETNETENKDAVEPDQSYEGENTEMSEFEQLVDTFTNSEDEEAKEAARIELERILEQAEQQAQ